MDQSAGLSTHATETASGRVFELLVDETKTHAFLNIRLSGAAKSCDPATVLAFLRAQGIAVLDDLRARLGAAIGAVERLPVAAGRAPVAGRDAEVRWIVASPVRPVAGAEERIDFHRVTEFVNVAAGQSICVLVDADPGTPGLDVFGREIAATKGRKATLRLGGTVRLGDDGHTVVARVDGCLRLAGDTLSVEDRFTVKGDVDFSVGNIDFNGQVVIHGGVLEGFSVKASKDILVRGAVSGATLEAGGDLRVQGGVAGHGKGVLRARGSVVVRYLDNVTVEAGADVHAQTEIMNSVVRSAGSVVVDRGRIIGGRITAANDVKVGVIGSAMCVPTAVVAGVDVVSTARLEDLRKEHAALAAQVHRIEQAVGPRAQDPAGVAQRPREKGDALQEMLAQLEEKRSQAEALRAEMEALAARPSGAETRASVAVASKLFPGVTVQIGSSLSRHFDDELAGPVKLRAVPAQGTIEALRGA